MEQKITCKLCTIYVVLTASIATIPLYGFDQPIGIFKAIDTGYANRPDLKKIERDTKANKELEKAAISGYLPQIQVEAGAGKASGKNLFAPKRFATLYFSQLLYSPAGPIQLYRITKQDTLMFEFQQLIQKDTIRFQATTGLLDLWFAQQKDLLVKEYDLTSKIVYAKQLHEYTVGLSNKDQLLQNAADFSMAQSRVRKYIDELIIASSNLERNIGIRCTPTMSINTSSIVHMIDQALSEEQGSADLYIQQAFENRQELRLLDEMIKKETYWQRFYCKSYFPSISLYTNVIHYVYNGLFDQLDETAANNALKKLFGFKTGWNAGVKLDWQFDGLENMFNSCASEERSFSAMMERLDKLQQIKQEVSVNHAKLQSLSKEYKVAIADYKRASNEIVLKHKQFEVGLISPVESKQAETVWLKAQYDYLTNKVNVAKQYQRLLYSCGYPDNPQKMAQRPCK